MCTVSMIGDHFDDKWRQPYYTPIIQDPQYATKEEIEALRQEVLEMKKLLKAAVKYDTENNEPNCQMEEKIAMLKKVAEIVGVDIEEVFK